MIDLESEDLIPLKDLAPSLPKRNGKAPAVSTLWRWSTTGVKGAVLETVLVGGQRYSSLEAFRRFVAAGNRDRVGPTNVEPAPPHREARPEDGPEGRAQRRPYDEFVQTRIDHLDDARREVR